jgi:feruloyl esterase
VFGTAWIWRGFELDRDMPIVDAALGDYVNDAKRGSLHAFEARGGKLIIYHGLADTLVPPEQSVAFYNRHARQVGGMSRLRDTARLFLAPGVMHCAGGPGVDSFNSAFAAVPQPPQPSPLNDLFAALTAWKERGKATEQVTATKFDSADPEKIAFQRPFAPFPAKRPTSDVDRPLHLTASCAGSNYEIHKRLIRSSQAMTSLYHRLRELPTVATAGGLLSLLTMPCR